MASWDDFEEDFDSFPEASFDDFPEADKDLPGRPNFSLTEKSGLSDALVGGVATAIDTAANVASVFNPNFNAESVQPVTKGIREFKSDYSKANDRRRSLEVAQAQHDDPSFFSGTKARVEGILRDKSSAAGDVAGSLAVPISAGKLAGPLGKAAQLAVTGATGAVVAAGQQRQQYFDSIQKVPDEQLINENKAYAAMRAKGMPEKEARRTLGEELTPKLIADMGIQAAIGFVAARFGAEGAVVGGRTGGILATGAKEAGFEAAQGTTSELGSQVTLQDQVPSTPVGVGAGAAGVESGVLGFAGGVGAGVISGKREAKQTPKNAAFEADLEKMKQKGAADKVAPSQKATIPFYPNMNMPEVTNPDGSVTEARVNADSNPVMVEVDVNSRIYKDYVASQSVDPSGQINMGFPEGPADVDPGKMNPIQGQQELFEQAGPPDGMQGQISPNVRQQGGQGELWRKQNEQRGPAAQPDPNQPPASPPGEQMSLFEMQPGQPIPSDQQPTYVSLIGEQTDTLFKRDNMDRPATLRGDSPVVNSVMGKTPEEGMKRLAKTASNPRLGYIFERVGMMMDILRQTGVGLDLFGMNNLKVNGQPALGATQQIGNNVRILYNANQRLSDREIENTLAHEGVHAVTQSLVNANQDAGWREKNKELSKRITELEGLFETAKTALRTSALPNDLLRHATENVHEFVAYGLTSPGVINALKRIPSGKSNLLMDFLRKMGNLLGFRPNDFHMYAELLSIFEDIAKNPNLHQGYKDAFKITTRPSVHAEYQRITGLDEYEAMPIDKAIEEMNERPSDIEASKAGQLLRSGIRHLAITTNHPMIKAAHTAIDKAMSEKRNQLRRILGSNDSLLSLRHQIPKDEVSMIRQILTTADRMQIDIDPDDFTSLSKASRDFMRKNQEELKRVLDFHNEKATAAGGRVIEARGGYKPDSFGGRERALVTIKTDGKTVPIGYVGEKTTRAYERAIEWVKKEHPEAKITKLPSRKSKEGVDSKEIESLVDLVRDAYPLGNIDESLLDIARQMDNKLFGMDKREKAKLGIWGSEGNKPWADNKQNDTEFMDSLFNYYDEAYTHAALQPALGDIRKMNRQFMDAAPNAVHEIEQYTKHVTGHNLNAAGALANNVVDGVMHFIDNNLDRFGIKADTGKGTAILRDQLTTMALGWFNMQYLAAQLIQPFQTAAPFAMVVTQRFGISDVHIAKSLANAGLQFGAHVSGANVKPDVAQILQFAEENGLTGQSHLEHTSAINKSKLNRGIDNAGGLVIQAGEKLTRLPMFLMFTDLIRKSPQGQMMDLDKVLQIAKNLTQYSMVDYNPEQRPQLYSELGFAGSLLGTFRTYQHGNISQMKTLAKNEAYDKGNIKPISMMMGVLFLLGGMVGMPLVEEADMLLSPFGVRPKDAMLKFFDPSVAKGALSDQIGFDVSSKYAFNAIIPDQILMAHAEQAWKPLYAAYELIWKDIIQNGTASPQRVKNLVREALPASAKNVFDTHANMDEDKKVLRGKDGTASVDLTREDIEKRKSLTGHLLQAKPLGESLRRATDFENSKINRSNEEAKAQIKADLKYHFGQGTLTTKRMEEMAREYVEKGGDPDQFTTGLERYIKEKDMPYILRGIDRGKANLRKKQALDNKYRAIQ